MNVDGFDWDEGNIEKCAKHGLSIDEIENLFTQEPLILVNTKHLSSEERLQAIGITGQGRYAFIVFMFRTKNKKVLIRPISARYMHRKEIEYYEQNR